MQRDRLLVAEMVEACRRVMALAGEIAGHGEDETRLEALRMVGIRVGWWWRGRAAIVQDLASLPASGSLWPALPPPRG